MPQNTRETFARWMAGRKFTLLLAYWFFCFFGSGMLYFRDAGDFQDKLDIFDKAMEWSFFGYTVFAGVEGVRDVINSVKQRKPVDATSQIDVSDP